MGLNAALFTVLMETGYCSILISVNMALVFSLIKYQLCAYTVVAFFLVTNL